MSKYLFIESRDPFESNDAAQTYSVVKELQSQGHKITLYLIQNGVFSIRNNASKVSLARLISEKNISIYADDYSIEERGITQGEIAAGIKIAPIEILVDFLMEDACKSIWH